MTLQGRYVSLQIGVSIFFKVLIVATVTFLAGCQNRSLPNGCSLFSSSREARCIVSPDGIVVVDQHVTDWRTKKNGEVIGSLSSGILFSLDTKTLVTTYSNGVITTKGDAVKIRNLPNGYSLYSGGNHLYISTPREFSIGHTRLKEGVRVSGSDVFCVNQAGHRMFLNTLTGDCRLEVPGRGRTVWATATVDGLSKIGETDAPIWKED